MDDKKLFMSKEFSLIIFFSVVVVETVLSVDQQFEACLPKNCSEGPSISYPFWINGEQNSSCGFPGFELSCKNRVPVFTMSGDEYIIRQIEYENQSFTTVKAGLSSNICSPHTYRVTFGHQPFTFAPASASLSIFFNCTALYSNDYSRYAPGCITKNTRQRSLALFSDDPLFTIVNQSGECATSVTIPIDMIGNANLPSRDFIVDFLIKGYHLNWNASRCDECAASGGRCGFNYTMYMFMCFCPDRPHQRRCGREGATVRKKVLIASVTSFGGVFVAAMLFIFWKRVHFLPGKTEKKAQRVVENFLNHYGSLNPKRYNYYDIKRMTSSFKDNIGQGGFGGVYRGKLPDGRLVAVKLLNKAKGDGQEFINEVASISRTSHVNIVSLLGFCFDGSKRALVYEFMANGSLEKFIYKRNPLEAQSNLGWESLYQIAIGVARGLEYLHRGCNTRILHFDIKPHNILLDQDFTPKISDFGLAKLCARNESIISMLDARGTAGYIAPELFSRNFGGVSHKSDVYSYGMMVLEMVGRRKNIDVGVNHTSEIYFPHWIYKRLELDKDPGLDGVVSPEEEELARKMILVALWCIQTNPMNRPAMSRVLEMLEGRQELLSLPPQPYLCSPERDPVGTSDT